MPLREICRGNWGVVSLIVIDEDECPAGDFIKDRPERDKAKIRALFERFAAEGKIFNREQFKKVDDNLFEFKIFQIRIFCFVENRRLLVTHGVIKKRDDLNPADITRARRIRALYEAEGQRLRNTGRVQ